MKFFTTTLSLASLFFASAPTTNAQEIDAWIENDNQFEMKASDGVSGDRFGSSLSAELNLTLIGATGGNSGTGAAYVFRRERYNDTRRRRRLQDGVYYENDLFTETAKLTPSDGASGDEFGASLVILGNYSVIGAPGHDLPGSADAGAVYVFKRSEDSEDWTEIQKLTSINPLDGGRFGQAIGYDGIYIFVGSPTDNTDGSSAGSVFSYKYNSETDKFDYDSRIGHVQPSNNNLFGSSVSARNGTVAIGVLQENPGTGGNAGTIQVYVRNNETESWDFQIALVPKESAGGDKFGQVVYMDYSRVVGSSLLNDDDNLAGNVGGSWTFDRNETTEEWNETGYLVADDLGGNDRFGSSMVVQANYLAIGASAHEGTVGSDAGAAYTYFYNATSENWKALEKLLPDGTVPGDEVGHSLGLYCDRLFVGAPGVDAELGVVYLYNQNTTFANETRCDDSPQPIRECRLGRLRPFCDPYECKPWQLACRLQLRRNPPPEPKECPKVFDPCGGKENKEDDGGDDNCDGILSRFRPRCRDE